MLGEEYKKESDGKTYLLLKRVTETFEEQMIQKARPIGVLPMVRSERGDMLKYEITGRKNLALTFERVPMNAEQVEAVLQGILNVLKGGREYLLAEDNFVLLPEHIYIRIPEYEVTLCYYPGYGIPFAEQLGKLFEVLLNRVDYREERAIAMVYALYMQLQEPDMTLERISEKLREQAERSGVEGVWKEDVTEDPIGNAKKENARSRGIASVSGREEFSEGNIVLRKTGWWERIRKEMGEKHLLRGERKRLSPALIPVSCVRETVPEWGTRYTEVLAVKPTESEPVLVSQRTGETVLLKKFPFYVGSYSGYMDYVIERSTVSRFHAKLIKQGDRVLLSDLNSTNGTKVNGRMLDVQEQLAMADGDCILFADEEYVFYENNGRAGNGAK